MNFLKIMVLLLALTCAACRRDMQDQPKFKPLQVSSFFADGRSARPIPAGTIARSEPVDLTVFYTGLVDGNYTDTLPLAIDEKLVERGQQRFNIFCSPCHGRLGDGSGMVARRGVRAPASLLSDRTRQLPPGYIFRVITNGFGGMPDYANQIPVRDRWAIIAYVRALELSRRATLADAGPQGQAQLGRQR